MSTYAVTDVANYFINHYRNSVDPMNLPRLQLFLYFAQAESLVRNGIPLFKDEIRAYPNGPAVTRMNFLYEEAGNSPIDVYGTYEDSMFTKSDLNLLLDVSVYYNKFSTTELIIMSYTRGGPWEQVFNKDSTHACTIDNDTIRTFHMDLPRIPSFMDVMLGSLGYDGVSCQASFNCDSDAATKVYTSTEMSDTWE